MTVKILRNEALAGISSISRHKGLEYTIIKFIVLAYGGISCLMIAFDDTIEAVNVDEKITEGDTEHDTDDDGLVV